MSDVGSTRGDIGGNGLDGQGWDESAIDWAFELLARERRRLVLEKLRTASTEAVSFDDLTDHLLAHDSGSDKRDRVTSTLHHTTLPRLEDARIVDLDRRTDTVRYRGNELVEEILDFVADRTA